MVKLSIPLLHKSTRPFYTESSPVAGSGGEVQVKNSTKQTSLSQQFWPVEVSRGKSRHVFRQLSTAASLYSGVCAQGCANIQVSVSLPFFFLV